METDEVLIRQLYAVVAELERRYSGRRFTLDGHLVGSLGEVIAGRRYGLKPLRNSTAIHDAVAPDGRHVQVKATQGGRVALYAEPEHLIVLRLLRDGTADEVFNGPGAVTWARVSKVAKNGQCSISVFRLRQLMVSVPAEQRLARSDGNRMATQLHETSPDEVRRPNLRSREISNKAARDAKRRDEAR